MQTSKKVTNDVPTITANIESTATTTSSGCYIAPTEFGLDLRLLSQCPRAGKHDVIRPDVEHLQRTARGTDDKDEHQEPTAP